jgi:hypothetical protein
MESLAPNEILFRIHSAEPSEEDGVSASVFNNKLGILLRALRAADQAIHNELVYDYRIARLSTSSPTAVLRERPKKAAFIRVSEIESPVNSFNKCARAIIVGERATAEQYGNTAKYIARLGRGSNKTFGYAEIWVNNDPAIRVDQFLTERANAVIKPATVSEKTQKWYSGVVHATFDGKVKEVDLRGALPEIKLILTAGGKEIDCVCSSSDIEKIREGLNRRVRLVGRAIYDGKSGLPRRIEVDDIVPVTGTDNIAVWRGAFEPFEAPDDFDEDNSQ